MHQFIQHVGISRCSGAEILKHLLKISIVSILLITDKVMGIAIRAGCVDMEIGQMSTLHTYMYSETPPKGHP